MPRNLVAELVFDKATKNKTRFREPGSDEEGGPQGVFPILYIRDEALTKAGHQKAERIKVTVEVLE